MTCPKNTASGTRTHVSRWNPRLPLLHAVQVPPPTLPLSPGASVHLLSPCPQSMIGPGPWVPWRTSQAQVLLCFLLPTPVSLFFSLLLSTGSLLTPPMAVPISPFNSVNFWILYLKQGMHIYFKFYYLCFDLFVTKNSFLFLIILPALKSTFPV